MSSAMCVSATGVPVDKLLATLDEDKHYVAGYFDGEGSIGLYRKRKKSGEVYAVAVRVTVTQQEPDIIVWLHSVFGGRLVRYSRPNSVYWVLSIESIDVCLCFLRWIIPSLRSPSKKSQAIMLLDYCNNYKTLSLEQKMIICDSIKAVKMGVKEVKGVSYG